MVVSSTENDTRSLSMLKIQPYEYVPYLEGYLDNTRLGAIHRELEQLEQLLTGALVA